MPLEAIVDWKFIAVEGDQLSKNNNVYELYFFMCDYIFCT